MRMRGLAGQTAVKIAIAIETGADHGRRATEPIGGPNGMIVLAGLGLRAIAAIGHPIVGGRSPAR